MPTYDYECSKCNKQVEIDKPMKDSHRQEKCEICGQVMEKLLSAPAFHLKGSGWYVTDYKNKGVKKDRKKNED